MRLVLQTFLLTFFLICTELFAQAGKISGVAKDRNTGETLVGVNIVVEGTKLGAATNLDGFFAILNVPPGTYNLRATLIGYNPISIRNVRVNIDQTTEQNLQLTESSISTAEVVVVAVKPVVQKDVSNSSINLSTKEMENLPVANASSVIGLQAGIQGTTIRGGTSDQTNWLLNGLSIRDERTNNPYTGISMTSVQEIQVLTGGFNAEYGNIRSGLVNVVTREGSNDHYSINFYGRYRPTAPKHFGGSANDPNSFWMRPFLDDAVAWTGTHNGNWNDFMQAQYPEFEGWNTISAQMFKDNPATALTPQELQKLYLWQHRKNTDIQKPDYDIDFSVGGYVPIVGQQLGNLRFLASYRASRSMYIIPLSRDAYTDNNFQLKLTSDIAKGMKLNVEGLLGQQQGTTASATGDASIFTTPYGIASALSYFSQYKTIENRIYTNDYFSPTTINFNNIGAKLTHALNSSTFYEVSFNRFGTKYNTNPGPARDTSKIKEFGNNYWVDQSPFGFYEFPSTGLANFRMSVGFSNARDSSKFNSYNLKFDLTSQLDKYNNLKTGFEFNYTENLANYASIDRYLPSGRYRTTWNAYPLRGSVYAQDKLEFEGMIANLGLRMDYSSANSSWYDLGTDVYSTALSSARSLGLDTLVARTPTKANVTFSPRLGIAFPLSENSKLFFNYGHFRSMPTPVNLYLLRRFIDNNSVVFLANPNNPMPRTIAYELGYEHNLLDMFLLRVAGYYKDVALQPLSVEYIGFGGKTDYSTPEPNSYADIRGFEATITKNRGDWVTGFINYTYMVSTSGRFGFNQHFQNPKDNRDFQTAALNNYTYLSKPIPQPYARANVDLFTPMEYGPKLGGQYLLEDWHFNILATWSSGFYFSWTGGGSIPGIVNNVQWMDNYGVDMKISKSFRFGPVNLQLFADVKNVFNFRFMDNVAGFTDSKDYESYMKSLHLPESVFSGFPKDENGTPKTGYTNINVPGVFVFGDDKPGDYRRGEYIPWDNNASEAQKNEWRKNKSYVDMPNQEYFTFLNPRDIYWGLRFSLELF